MEQYKIIAAAFQLDASYILHPDCFESVFNAKTAAMILLLVVELLFAISMLPRSRDWINVSFKDGKRRSSLKIGRATVLRKRLRHYSTMGCSFAPGYLQAILFKSGYMMYGLYAPLLLDLLVCDEDGSLRSNPFFKCFEGEHLLPGTIAIVCVVTYLVGFPLMAERIRNSASAGVETKTWNIFIDNDNVRPEKWWWRQVTMLLLLVIAMAGTVKTVDMKGQLIQLGIVEVSLAVFLGMLAFFRPYTMLWQNMAKAAMCILSMMGSALNFLGYLQIEGIVGENVVINVSIALFSMLAIFAVFMIVAFGVEVVRTAREEETLLQKKFSMNPAVAVELTDIAKEDDGEDEAGNLSEENTFSMHNDDAGNSYYLNRKTSIATYAKPKENMCAFTRSTWILRRDESSLQIQRQRACAGTLTRMKRFSR